MNFRTLLVSLLIFFLAFSPAHAAHLLKIGQIVPLAKTHTESFPTNFIDPTGLDKLYVEYVAVVGGLFHTNLYLERLTNSGASAGWDKWTGIAQRVPAYDSTVLQALNFNYGKLFATAYKQLNPGEIPKRGGLIAVSGELTQCESNIISKNFDGVTKQISGVYDYFPLLQNSNSYVVTLLTLAGLTLPPRSGGVTVPGATSLPFAMTGLPILVKKP